jgi:hypothetical protein
MRILVFAGLLLAALIAVLAIGTRVFSGPVPVRAERVSEHPPLQHQFPNVDENESAARVLATLARFDEEEWRRQREHQIDYMRAEIASPSSRTQPPPKVIADFLAKNASIISALRAQLASNAPPVWKLRANDVLDAPQPDLIKLNHVAITLAANALANHSAGHDTAAWSDLGATWILAKSLWIRPELAAVNTALTGSRLVAAVATKLPAPPPPWWSDYASFDVRPAFAQALEYQAWAMHTRAARYPVGEPDDDASLDDVVRKAVEPLARPIVILQTDAEVRDVRRVASLVTSQDPCVTLPEGDRARWEAMLYRLNRFALEREAAERLLSIEAARKASGSLPNTIETRSSCTHDQWVYKPTATGYTLTFSRKMPPPNTRIVTPLEYAR